MSEAFGTSTPTSITVVQTSSCDRGRCLNCVHHRGLLRGRQAAVQQADPQRLELALQRLVGIERGLQVAVLGLLDHRAHPVGLLAFGAGLADAREHLAAPRVGAQARR